MPVQAKSQELEWVIILKMGNENNQTPESDSSESGSQGESEDGKPSEEKKKEESE